jgi:hypothetical protein
MYPSIMLTPPTSKLFYHRSEARIEESRSKITQLLIALTLSISAEAGAISPNLKCTSEFEIINELIIIKPNSSYKNESQKICITENGGFHILDGGELAISNATIILNNDNHPKEQGALATLEPGSTIRMDNVKISAITQPKGKEIRKNHLGKITSHVHGVSKAIIGATTPEQGIRLEINRSTFSVEHNYSLGGILIQPRTSTTVTSSGWSTSTLPEMTPQRDAIETAGVTGWIKNSKFNKIFTPVALVGANNFKIENNYFSENPGGNIVASGRNLSIKENKIIFPGNGYVGDGITIYSILENSSIKSNTIIGGSCYGIQIANPKINNVKIIGNHISSGITSGIYISNDYKKQNKNIEISSNYISGNAGFGIAIESGVGGLLITSNVFSANAKSFGEFDIAKSITANAQIKADNLSAVGIDTTWAEGRQPDRTHVNKSTRVFSY